MLASTPSLDLCFIFTIIHHNTVISTVRQHGFSLERLELIFVSRGTFSLLEGLFLSAAMLLSSVMAWDSDSSPCPFVALSSLTAQRRDRVWCVFWRPAALSTLRPLRWHYGSWAPEGDRGGEWWGWGGSEGWVTAIEQQTEQEREERRRWGEGAC